MYNKKLFVLIAAGLLAFSTVIILIQVWGVPLKNFTDGIVVSMLYGLIIFAYLMRFVLIFIGVFALYRILQERHYKQIAK